ncbi:hypothetical protein BC941DRAFT_371707 [Chlamydoabsidia padenii]|nr:hypothetical protein BC941DRAFT_371707 [Chlamydoabsidia padenii]
MYFSLPTSQERLQHQQQQSIIDKQDFVDSHPSASHANSTSNPPPTSNMNYLTDERLVEIVENLEDHWRSPPILTPTTLAMIFNNSYGDIGTPFPPSKSTTTANNTTTNEKDVISTASLQCFLSQLQKTAALHLPPLEKAIKVIIKKQGQGN